MSLDVELALKEEKLLGELVTVEDVMHPSKGKCVVVRAKGWLGGDWHKVNELLKKKFPKVEWISLGKQSHWCISLESIMKPSQEKVSMDTSTRTIREEKAQFPIPLEKKETTQPQKVHLDPMIDIYDEEILEQLKHSKEQQGFLTKVKKDQYGKILSGKHRKKVDSEWPEDVVEVKDELDRELKIIHFNVQRRVPVEETATRLLRIAKLLEAKGTSVAEVLPQISNIVPYSERWVRELLPDKYKQEAKKREQMLKATIFAPKVFTVWNFSNCDERFGIPDFPGRIPGQIIEHILYYYTNEGDLIVDPMAGSGTTYDVCQLMKRKSLCYDVKPIRPEIKQHDITQGYPEETKGCNLIFLDPPYFKKLEKKERYNSIGEMSREDFLSFIAKLAKDSFEIVLPYGIVALLISDYIDGENSLLTSEYYNVFKQAGFKAINHIQTPLPTQEYSGPDVDRAKKQKQLLNITRDLYVFRKC